MQSSLNYVNSVRIVLIMLNSKLIFFVLSFSVQQFTNLIGIVEGYIDCSHCSSIQHFHSRDNY